jgi:hypothetical protein
MAPGARRLVQALTRNQARSTPASDDTRLRGRTYAVPFDKVWQAAVKLAGGGLRGWSITHADDHDGVIRAEARALVMRTIDDVEITIALDADAQTRVDMVSASRKGFADLGANSRRIGKFFRALDHALAQATTRAQLEVAPMQRSDRPE